MRDQARYDVALSFAGENREYVQAVAEALVDARVKVFYDDYEKVALWGKDLYAHLDYVYRKASRYCVLFASEHYARKVWTNHERSSAQARALEENAEYVLPARFDATEIPGLRPTIGYLDISNMPPEKLADLIKQKLGPARLTPGVPRKLDRLYKSLHLQGPKNKEARKEARQIVASLYEALGRMSIEERKSVAGVLAFGCPGELPEGVHISLDYLSRMTGVSQTEIMESLAAVRSLNVKVKVREAHDIHPLDEGEIRGADKDLLLSFWASRAPRADDSTKVAYTAIQQAARHFCDKHGLNVITGLDFHRLSGEEVGPLLADEQATNESEGACAP